MTSENEPTGLLARWVVFICVSNCSKCSESTRERVTHTHTHTHRGKCVCINFMKTHPIKPTKRVVCVRSVLGEKLGGEREREREGAWRAHLKLKEAIIEACGSLGRR